ncbi:MAG TPA: ABC transporter ATP-binding protein [Candidatus Omnitrophota bacterium]|nr:ABC transporter ATP-binding protein [Candidatus Omnitrophota bacterium]
MIEVKNLEFSYGKRKVLNGVSLKIPDGAVFGMLGPNGSGKTTLFRILSTLLAPEKGSATWLGHDLFSEASAVRETLGIVFQYPSLDAQLTVEENLKCQGALYGLRGADLTGRIEARLKKLGVWDRRKDKVKNLSGGLKRRVELAKALLHDPQVLLLDEPSTGLDPRARAEFWDFLSELNRDKKMTMLVTTHLMEEAEKCSQLVILDEGRIIAEGSPAALKSDLSPGFISIETSDAAEIGAEIASHFGVRAEKTGRGLRVEHAEPQKVMTEIMARFSGRVESVAFHKASLEDVFLKKTGRSFESAEEGKHVKK